MKNQTLSAYAIGILALFLNANIHASQDLIFSETQKPTAKVFIKKFLDTTKDNGENYLYSEHDINNDGFPEFFLQSKNCEKTTPYCKFYILAKKETETILLLEINAKKIAISDTKSNGIHDILAILDKKNDYKYERFTWSPAEMTFKPALTKD